MPFCLVHSRRLCLETRLINGLLLMQSCFQIYQIYHRSSSFPSQYSNRSREGAPGAWAPPYFSTKMRPEGVKKNFFGDRPPPSSQAWDDHPPLICRSGSATAIYHLSTSFPSQYTSNRWYIARIFQIWSVPGGYEELAGGFKPIRKGEIF